MFNAWFITKTGNDSRASLLQMKEEELPEEAVTVRVSHSAINYKDALALTGTAPIVRRFPMIPGSDLAGIVEASSSPLFEVGDKVVLNGWELGETHWGGLSELARVKAEWLIKLPDQFTFAQSMAIGTAGYTAMLAILSLEKQGVVPDTGEILVTGANGGVGGFAIALLAKLGYHVVASTGRPEESDYLKALGAQEIVDRAQFSSPGKALAKERWAAAIDNVGSHTLANVCASLRRGGVVAACGMAQGIDFPGTVAPFIIRGITLVGVDSVLCPMPQRLVAWSRLAKDLDPTVLERIATQRPLSSAMDIAEELLAGRVRGRIVINVAG
jgi:acrylyl-CoA reductase (NADPH)